jgi:hypothetical protein
VGAPTDAARAEVLARRAELLAETQRLEASARAAVDIPAKIKRQPAKTAGIAAGTAFLVLGGPQRVYRRARRAVFGPQADLPKAMLPKEIEKNLKKLGSDGDKVRPILEREFASYLNDRTKIRAETDRGAQLTAILGNILRPVSYRAGLRLAEQLFDPERQSYEETLARLRARASELTSGGGATTPPSPATGEPMAPSTTATTPPAGRSKR